MSRLFILFTLLVLVFSCKKENPTPINSNSPTPDNPQDSTIVIVEEIQTHDSIHSSEYLAAYPGSWWEYDNSTTINCSEWNLVGVIKKTKTGNIELHKKYIISVPKYDNWYIFGKGRATISSEIDSSKIEPIVDEIPGTFFTLQTSGSNQTHTTNHISYGILDTLRVKNVLYHDVLHIQEKINLVFIDWGSGPMSYTHKFYARGIGLIQKVEYSPTAYYDTTSLINYYIAPH